MLELCGEAVAFWSCCGGSGSVGLVVEEVEQAKGLDLEAHRILSHTSAP